jgi:hypothetical protein
MNDKFDTRKEVVVTYFKVPCRHSSGGIEKNHETPLRIVGFYTEI